MYASLVLSALSALALAQVTDVDVNWNTPQRQLITTPAFQTVVNSLTTRVAPQHDAIFNSIAQLGAQYQVSFDVVNEVFVFLEWWTVIVCGC
jgi:hypothetical protein